MNTPASYRTMIDSEELRDAICAWLRDNDIDPGLVPATERPDCSYHDGGGTPLGGHTITTRLHVIARRDGGPKLLRPGRDRVEETTITLPMKAAPPPIVQEYLDARCPTCDR